MAPIVGGGWAAACPAATVPVLAVDADVDELWFRLTAMTDGGLFVLAFAPFSARVVLAAAADLAPGWPVAGDLHLRNLQVTTRLGRRVHYALPTFTPTAAPEMPRPRGEGRAAVGSPGNDLN